MSSEKLRIAFMGTPDFAAVALKALIDAGHDVVAVYSQPPRPKGRGNKVQKSPTHELAESHNISVYTPVSFKKEPAAVTAFQNLDLDVAIVAAYGLLLPKSILDAPKHGCLNIHGSLLPRWRGAAPIQRAILDGDAETGITIMQMDVGLDTGPMILKDSVPITAETNAQNLHDALADMGARLTLDALDTLACDGKLDNEVQPEEGANYASRLSRDDGRIDWTNKADYIERQLRALTPWPGVWCTDADGKRLKIHAVELSDASNLGGEIGQILDKKGNVRCGDQALLRLTRVQPENAKAMDFASALNGGYIAINDILG
ncbi:MAG: methionyl-tRNA formyltransferase [Alphaproteobacteria bacterium]|nr:methionyl-tRNA formyltransferase [Alphaproteobacteria bacterium]|tara:strand:+ start:240 stop:1190 length:951 start_codon:yes stop_codon:yes gene_type:complete